MSESEIQGESMIVKIPVSTFVRIQVDSCNVNCATHCLHPQILENPLQKSKQDSRRMPQTYIPLSVKCTNVLITHMHIYGKQHSI